MFTSYELSQNLQAAKDVHTNINTPGAILISIDEAKSLLQKADAGDVDSQYQLGVYYLTKGTINISYPTPLRYMIHFINDHIRTKQLNITGDNYYLKLATNNDNIKAKRILDLFYVNDYVVTEYPMELKQLSSAACISDEYFTKALYDLGHNSYIQMRKTFKTHSSYSLHGSMDVIKYYLLAANRGHKQATKELLRICKFKTNTDKIIGKLLKFILEIKQNILKEETCWNTLVNTGWEDCPLEIISCYIKPFILPIEKNITKLGDLFSTNLPLIDKSSIANKHTFDSLVATLTPEEQNISDVDNIHNIHYLKNDILQFIKLFIYCDPDNKYCSINENANLEILPDHSSMTTRTEFERMPSKRFIR